MTIAAILEAATREDEQPGDLALLKDFARRALPVVDAANVAKEIIESVQHRLPFSVRVAVLNELRTALAAIEGE